MSVPVHIDDAWSLIDHGLPPALWRPLVHDVRRRFPAEIDGVEMLAQLQSDEGVELDSGYDELADRWQDAASRPFDPDCDIDLADVMRSARRKGWRCSPSLEALFRHQNRLDARSEREAEVARAAELERVHDAWLKSGEPDWYEEWKTKRAADRAAAETEYTAIRKRTWAVTMASTSTEAQCEVAEAVESRALAAWHQKYDHFFRSIIR